MQICVGWTELRMNNAKVYAVMNGRIVQYVTEVIRRCLDRYLVVSVCGNIDSLQKCPGNCLDMYVLR